MALLFPKEMIFQILKTDLPPGAMVNIYSTLHKEGDNVTIFLLNDDGWIRVMVNIGENCTTNAIRRVIPDVLELRNWIMEFQGPLYDWFEILSNSILTKEISYGQFANSFNEDIANRLCKYLETKDNDILDVIFSYLKRLKFSEDEICEIIENGIENHHLGHPIFEKGYPLSREKVISLIRIYRKSPRHKFYKEEYEAIQSK